MIASLFLVFSLLSFLIVSWNTFLFFLVSFFSIYLYSMCFSFNSFCSMAIIMSDELSLFMVYITVLVLYLSYVFSLSFNSFLSIGVVFYLLSLFCIVLFCCDSLFILYLCYEASLIPIVYIIINWGSYPERSLSALMLILYTSIFSFPFLFFLFHVLHSSGTLLFSVYITLPYNPACLLSTLLIFFAFSVNLPMYGLHFWLPIAHVEAPTFGSIILAGVLLNLGGVGLLRCLPLMNVFQLKYYLTSYLFIFIVVVTLVCCFQSDFNRLVAYSSVSHIIAIPILLVSSTLTSFNTTLLLMFFHGLSSPIMFMLVGVLYSIFSTRQLICLRGLLLVSPIMSFYLVVSFFFTLSAPPFPSFISEVFFFLSSFQLSPHFLASGFFFLFLSLLYNLNWISSVVFNETSNLNIAYLMPYSYHFSFSLVSIFCVFSLSLLSFI